MIVVRGALRDYPWGRHDGLAPWTPATDGPQAELWFGAHPSAPSPLVSPDAADDLAAALEGVTELPLLVKLLTAARPLSIQVHPGGSLAQRWWEEGSSLLRDGCEKTEMLVALDDFSVFVGLREPAELTALLTAVGLPAPAARAAQGDLAGALTLVLGLTPAEQVTAVAAVPAVAATALPYAAAGAILEVLDAHPGDPGVLVALCLQHHLLHPGDAVFVPAGVVHAYVRGLGVEVMTSSDNVLRLGLTPKEVAVAEALEAADLGRRPVVLGSVPGAVQSYRVSDAPFVVTRVHGRPGRAASVTVPADGHAVVLAVFGTTAVEAAGRPVRLRGGLAAVLLPDDGAAGVSTEGLAFIAHAPSP